MNGAMTGSMTGPRITIVTYNWPPRNAIGTHRPYAWAKYWAEAGARVTVLTAAKQPFDAPLDLHLADPPGVEVIEVAYGQGRRLVFQLLKTGPLRRLARTVKSWLGRNAATSLDPRRAWLAAARPQAERLAAGSDVVVSTFGPDVAHLIACEMKRANPGLRWVADYRDLWSQRHDAVISEAARTETERVERETVGRHADLLTAVSEDMVRKLSTLAGKPAVCIPNGFDIDEGVLRARLAEGRAAPGRPFRIAHTGTVYEGSRNPTPLLEALAQLRDANALAPGDVTVDFYGERVAVAEGLARNPRYGPFLRIMGHVPREAALQVQRAASLLLLLESPEEEARGVLTGKIFEYMAAGRPILCIGSRPEFEIGQVLARTGTGSVFGPEQTPALADTLQRTLAGGGLFADYAPRIERILEFSRRRQAHGLLAMLTQPVP